MPKLSMLRPRIIKRDTRRVKPPPRHTDSTYKIYGTPEYAAWRKAVIDRAQARCEYPGCRRKERRMFADHIRELRDGGAPYDVNNGQCLCGSHHTAKTMTERARRAQATP